MRKKYTKVKTFIEIICERKSSGETNREITAGLRVTLKQVKQFINRENRRERLVAQGYVPRPQGRPRKSQEMSISAVSIRLKPCAKFFCDKLLFSYLLVGEQPILCLSLRLRESKAMQIPYTVFLRGAYAVLGIRFIF